MKKVYARIIWLCLVVSLALISFGVSVGGLAAANGDSPDLNVAPETKMSPIVTGKLAPAAGVSVTMSTAVTSPTKQSPFTVTAVFSEVVTGFVEEDLVIANGVVSNFTLFSASDIYTFAVTPQTDGLVTVVITAGAGITGGDLTLPATLTVVYDGTPPGVQLSSDLLSGGEETMLSTVPLTATFSEPVLDFVSADLIAVNGIISQFTAVTSATYTFHVIPQAPGLVSATIPADVAADPAGNGNAPTLPFTFTYAIEPSTIYLPLVAKPYNVAGEIGFDAGARDAGQTTFVPTVTVDLSPLTFPSDPQPEEIRIWIGGEVIPTWEPYSAMTTTYQVNLLPTQYGAQTINVQFRAGDARSNILPLTLFYVPNGDFASGDLSAWSLNTQLPVTVQGDKLRLGDESFNCNGGVPLGVALAVLNLNLPDGGDYVLHVMGTTYTEDQNPNNTATYDAFEIHLGGALAQRYSNQAIPINCDRDIRTVEIDFQTSLASYSGSARLSLENWSRFDNFFNTYTDIDQVWVSEN